MKTISLNQTGWTVDGEAVLNLWGGGQGSIEMDKTFIPLGSLTLKTLINAINDGQFGCESIEEAHVYVAPTYEKGLVDYESARDYFLYSDRINRHSPKKGV